MAISGSGELFQAMDGHFWQWITISGNRCPFLRMDVCFRDKMSISGNGGVFMGMDGHFWQWMAIFENG